MTSLEIRIPGECRGKGRPRFGNGRTFTDAKTMSAENWFKACAMEQVGQTMLDGPLSLTMAVTVAVPQSWSRKRQSAAHAQEIRPTGKPDCDNQIKLACDALNKIVWLDDAQIVDVTFSRRYGATPETLLIVMPLGAKA